MDSQIMRGFNLLEEFQQASIANSESLMELAESLNAFIRHSEYKPAYSGGILDVIGGISEPLTSQIIKNILSYKDDNGKFILLESFIRTFINSVLKVKRPIISAEKGLLDVAIKDKHYAIVIENKLKDAAFQRNQLARYIAKLKQEYNEEAIFVVILPQFSDTNIRLSAGRLPLDWQENNDNRKCAIDRYECWCDYPSTQLSEQQTAWCAKCDKHIFSRLKNNTHILHDDFAEWLLQESDILPSNQWPIKSCMLQFAYYLKGLYSTRYSAKLNMAITEFLKEKFLSKSAEENAQIIKETISELDQLRTAILRLKGDVAHQYIKEWRESLTAEYTSLKSDLKNDVLSFGLEVNGIWIGCWSGNGKDNEDKPYWGFFCHETPTKAQIKMVEQILYQCEIKGTVNTESHFLVWDNTLHGDVRCRAFYRVAKDLGYLKE